VVQSSDPGEHLGLIAGEDPVEDLHAQHEVAVLGVVLVEAEPLQAKQVAVAERLPTHARAAVKRLARLATVFLTFDAFELVHGAPEARVDRGRLSRLDIASR